MLQIPDNLEKYKDQYSEDGLMDKIKNVAKKAGLKVIYAVLLLYYILQSDTVDNKTKLIIYGALGYFILPVDLIPDILPGGYVDDLGALIYALKEAIDCITPEIKIQAKNKLHDWFGEFDEGLLDDFLNFD